MTNQAERFGTGETLAVMVMVRVLVGRPIRGCPSQVYIGLSTAVSASPSVVASPNRINMIATAPNTPARTTSHRRSGSGPDVC